MRSRVSSPRLSDQVSLLFIPTWHRTHIPNILFYGCICGGACSLCYHLPICGFSACGSCKNRGDSAHTAVHALRKRNTTNGKHSLFAQAFFIILRGIWLKPIALTIKMPPIMLPSHSNTPGCITSIQRTHNFINSHTAWRNSKSSRRHRPPAILIT